MAKYSENIRPLNAIEHLRLRPGMYIGSTSSKGITSLLTDLLKSLVLEQNAIKIQFNIICNRTFKIQWKSIEQPIILLTHLTTFQWSEKGMRNPNFMMANALCSDFMLSQTQNTIWTRKGVLIKQDTISKQIDNFVQGTFESEIFDDDILQYQLLFERIELLAYQFPNCIFQLLDSRADFTLQHQFHFPNGLKALVQKWQRQDLSVYDDGDSFYLQHESITAELHWYFGYHHRRLSLVNHYQTHYDGTHVDSVKRGLELALQELEEEHHLKRLLKYPEQLEKQFSFIISIHLANPLFTGSTKSRLGNEEIQPILENWLKEAFLSHFSQSA